MTKKERNGLNFERLRAAALSAISNWQDEDGKDSLELYLAEHAKKKPTAFLNLLLKLATEAPPEVEDNKVTRVELVAPSARSGEHAKKSKKNSASGASRKAD